MSRTGFMRIFCLAVLWTKLQGLPQANSLELGAFFVLILFVGEFCPLASIHRCTQ
uniref:Uncharacterized protein n=1 Tax=Stegastes partitus TaxID=144197 RepID=A0A3B5ANB6_9TELE